MICFKLMNGALDNDQLAGVDTEILYGARAMKELVAL